MGNRTILDDIIEGTRRLLEDLDRVFNPQKHQERRERVPVRIPDRDDSQKPNNDTYR
jgi:hypothetical protein